MDFEGLESWYTNDNNQNNANFGTTDNNGSGFSVSHQAGPLSENQVEENKLVNGAEQTTTLKIGIKHGNSASGLSIKDKLLLVKNTGGKAGGHVLAIFGDKAYGFTNYLPGDESNHIFSKKKGNWNSHFHSEDAEGVLNPDTRMTSIFTTQVSLDQYSTLYSFYKTNTDNFNKDLDAFAHAKGSLSGTYAPYDYAVFGKRCASSCVYQLTQVGVLNNSYTFSLRIHSTNPGMLIKYLRNKAETGNEWTYEKKAPETETQLNIWDK